MKLSLEYLKSMLDMRKTLLYCAQKDLEQALAELDQREYLLANAKSANAALKRQNDHFRQKYVDASSHANDMTIEVATLNDEIEALSDINRGLLQVVNELRTQVDWWRQQDSDTGWLCANDYQPCVHREQSDDNTCQHFPQEEVFVRVMNNDPEDTTLPGWAEVSERESS
jgi:hypothetical protein